VRARAPALPVKRRSNFKLNQYHKCGVLRPIFPKRILSSEVNQTICTKCGAELIPGTSYCRQCGQPAIESGLSSEQVTAIFGQTQDPSTTKLLDPRPTTPAYEVNSDSLAASSASSARSRYSWPKLITICLVLLVLVVVSVGVMWSLRAGRQSATIQISRALIYPGSRTVVDVSDSGGAVLQLETPDALDKVRAWYEGNLKPTKTLRVTSTSVILKNENVTATLVSENSTTSIVIKQAR
jgi:ribosomal protein L40E